jgi:hypothetical protein
LVQDLASAGFRRGRAVPYSIVAVGGPTVRVGERRLEVLAMSAGDGCVDCLVRVDDTAGHAPTPWWWVLDVDGRRDEAITDGLQTTVGGQVGHLAMVG